MQKINYITNLSVDDFSGGWSGMNHNVYQQLKKKYTINLIEKVDPPYHIVERISSKLFRTLGYRGVFPAFSRYRLNEIKSLVEPKINTEAAFNFFHGATPWLHVRSTLPYALYLDACFATYITVYHNSGKFSGTQLNFIFKKETEFLEKANAVFFSSAWALEQTRKHYSLVGNNFRVAGLGGDFQESKIDSNNISRYFLFVGLDFFGKGGDMVVDAFNQLQNRFPEFQLKIVGERPPEEYLRNKNITYEGRFDKSKENDAKKLQELFARAYCFVLPTAKDMTPLVLVEASGCGCPSISVNNFGIPEIIQHRKTGLLIESAELSAKKIMTAMEILCTDPVMRNELGKNAAEHIRNNFTWDKTGQIITSTLTTGI